MRYVFGRRTRALCSRGNGVRSLWALFFGKSPLSFVPFLERIGAIICPPRLGSSRCWGSEETEIAAIADGACWRVWERNFSSRARQQLTRVNCWRKMYCLLHLLIQQEVLCWLMVGWWRRRGYFWAFTACLPRVCRAAGGYEAYASARLDQQWRHEKGGVARSRLDEWSLSGHNLPAPVSLPFLPDLHSEIM